MWYNPPHVYNLETNNTGETSFKLLKMHVPTTHPFSKIIKIFSKLVTTMQ